MGMWIQNYITRAFKPPCDISITFSDARTMKQVQCLYPHVAASWVSHRRYICNLLPPLSLFWNRCIAYLLSHWDIHYICFRFLASKFCLCELQKYQNFILLRETYAKTPPTPTTNTKTVLSIIICYDLIMKSKI